jgi:hypothetical protein
MDIPVLQSLLPPLRERVGVIFELYKEELRGIEMKLIFVFTMNFTQFN